MINPLKPGFKISEAGNKAKFLLFLLKHRFRIPVTYILPANLYNDYLRDKQLFPERLRNEIKELPQKPYAVRSSAKSEDTEEFTYAGQFRTITNVEGVDNILKAVLEVWNYASFCKETEYHKKIKNKTSGCAVLIQEMIRSELAGVSFSKNPITNQDEIIIEAVEGPGEILVQKGLTPLRWKFRKKKLLEGNPDYLLISVIKKVASDTLKLKRIFRKHVDIEWVFDGNNIFYLQFRPVTGTRDINIYSNKMAKEMLPGQIKPLVWSVNIPLVNGTWIRLLSEITGKLDVLPEDLAKSFYFRTYFNIAALSRIFREFGLSTDALEILMISSDDSKPSFKPGFMTIRHLFRIIRFIRHKLGFEKIFLNEYGKLTNVYKDLEKKIRTEFSIGNFQELYNSLFKEGGSLTYLNIVTPIMMHIYNRRLKSKLKKRKIDYEQLDFNSDFPELKDLSPLTHINKIRSMIDLLPDQIRPECNSYEKLKKYPEGLSVVGEIEKFLREFGHLSESGTDFSVPKWNENPEYVFNMILKSEPAETRSDKMDFNSLKQKFNVLSSGLQRSYLKAGRFKVFREKISSFFIYGHGLFRLLYLGLGNEFANRGVIDSTGDIFYLGVTEINKILDEIKSGEVNSYNEIITTRKNEMEATRDYILPSVIYGDRAPILEIGKNKNHRGVCSSSGIYTGKTRVVKGIDDFGNVKKGDVILIPFSDVSWTPVLSIAGAIVSETGGLLSHCSIMAREMGIPALASVENACSIGNGMNVTVDGSNGILTIHDYE